MLLNPPLLSRCSRPSSPHVDHEGDEPCAAAEEGDGDEVRGDDGAGDAAV